MGKGKGKLSIWFNKLSTGVVFIELKNLRRCRAVYFLSQAQNKLKSTSKIIFCGSFEKNIYNPVGRTTTSYQSF